MLYSYVVLFGGMGKWVVKVKKEIRIERVFRLIEFRYWVKMGLCKYRNLIEINKCFFLFFCLGI